ncbi:MAG: hypothetical protein WAT23_15350 [Chromatiaceae bacterium]
MMLNRPLQLLTAAAFGLLLSRGVQAQTVTPSAFISFSPLTIRDGGGASLQRATIAYQDQSYQVMVNGLGVGGAKGTLVKVTGEVYGLNDAADLEGDFVSELADAPPREVSTDDLWLDSVRGVSLRLYTDNRAITLASGSDTVIVKFGWEDFGWEE